MSSMKSKSSQEVVNQICNDFLKKGEKPSVRLILAEIPNISSTSTIHKYFSKWKDEQIKKQESLFEKFGLSTEFTTSFMKEISRFSIEIEERYKEQAQDATDQQGQAISDLEKSENKLNNQAEVVNQQEKQITDLQTELAKEQKSNESIVNEIRRQLTTTIDDNKQLAIQNESLRAGKAKAELKLESNQQLVDEIKSLNFQLTSENKELNSNIVELNKISARHESTIIGNDKLILALEAEQEKTEKQLSNIDSNNEKLQSELASVRSELSAINSKITEEKEMLAQQKHINAKLKTSLEEQARTHEKILGNYETTIAANEKLIFQLEKTKSKAN